MKIMKPILPVILIGCVLFAACSNEQTREIPQPSGRQYLNVAVAIPETGLSGTKTVDEDDVQTIDIFMFNQSDKKFATVTHYDRINLTGPTDGYKGKIWRGEPAGTTAGEKYIVAGVNLSASMVEKMKTLICDPAQLALFQHTIAELTENGMVMFSSTAEPRKADQFYDTKEEAEAPGAYVYTIDVDRSVAKMAVFKGRNMEITGGGKFLDLNFGWANVNNSIAYVPKITVNGSVETPAYDWASITKYSPEAIIPLYETTDPATTPTVFAYAQENRYPYTTGTSMDKLTYLRITGKYIPSHFSYLNTDHIAQDVNPANTPATFYALETTDSKFYYFNDLAKAQAVLTAAGTGSVPSFKTNVGTNGIRTYTGGVCHFDALINNAPSDETKHNIVRNTYYRITINSIKAPGLPGSGTNPNPGPGNGEQWLGFSINVKDWTDVIEGIEI